MPTDHNSIQTTPSCCRFFRLFSKAWQGELSFAKAFWVIHMLCGFLLGLVLFLILMGVTMRMMSTFAVDQMYYSALVSALVRVLALPYSLFAAICVWRCAKHSKTAWKYLGLFLVLVGVLWSIITLAVMIGNAFL